MIKRWVRSCVLAFFAFAPQATSLLHAQSAAASSSAVTLSIPDTVVFDQDNRKLHFYSDLIKGKAVAVDFIFTTCTTICPPLTANFAKLQKIMRERGENDFQLISVSVDPETDTPEKLKRYAELFGAKAGWTFVTGTRAELEPIWRAFKVYTSNKLDHTAMVVIGDDTWDKWIYASGLSSAKELGHAIDSVLNGKPPVHASAAGYKEGRRNSQ